MAMEYYEFTYVCIISVTIMITSTIIILLCKHCTYVSAYSVSDIIRKTIAGGSP